MGLMEGLLRPAWRAVVLFPHAGPVRGHLGGSNAVYGAVRSGDVWGHAQCSRMMAWELIQNPGRTVFQEVDEENIEICKKYLKRLMT